MAVRGLAVHGAGALWQVQAAAGGPARVAVAAAAGTRRQGATLRDRGKPEGNTALRGALDKAGT